MTETIETVEAPTEDFASWIGQVLTHEQIAALPERSVIRSSRGFEWVKINGDMIRSLKNGRAVRAEATRPNFYTLTSLPSSVFLGDTSEETPSEVLSLIEFKQRFKTLIEAQAQEHGIARDTIDDTLEAMDCRSAVTEFGHFVGMHVAGSDERLIHDLPEGTILVTGNDPSDWSHFAVLGVEDGCLNTLLGGETNHRLLRVHRLPNDPVISVFDRSGSELPEIREFIKTAWEVGWSTKQAHGWCETYEACMGRAGITQPLANAVEAETLTAEQVAELPEGTLLRYIADSSKSVIYRRDDRSQNPARTVWAGGSLSGNWARLGMSVVAQAGEAVRIPVLSYEELEEMPSGTVIAVNEFLYRRRDDGRWAEISGSGSYVSASHNFCIEETFYVDLP